MESRRFVVISSMILATIMLTTAFASETLNVLPVQNANAQILNRTTTALPGLHMMQMRGMLATGQISNIAGQNISSSVSIFQPILNAYKSLIHVSLADAITSAQKSLGKNTTAVAAFIHPENGFIVYNVFAIGSNGAVYKVLVDPGNGNIISSQQMSLIDMIRMVHGGMAMRNMGIMGQGIMGQGIMGQGMCPMMGQGMCPMMGQGMMGSGLLSNLSNQTNNQ